ncbi:MAG: HAD family hydrolase [Brevirhabdus sp.]
MTIEAVVFDIGNVLIRWQPEQFYDAEVGEERRRALFDTVDLHAMNEAVDSGERLKDTVYATAEKHPEFADEIRLWHDRWTDLAAPAIPHSVHLLRQLRARGVSTFVLSNIGDDTFQIACDQYDFLKEFDRFFISGAMRAIKPEPEIYRMVEEESGLPPVAMLFADDRAENVDAATRRGWHGHVFTHPQGWADRLVAEGLLTREEARHVA